MANKVLRTSLFDKYYKRYAKKFKSLPADIKALELELLKNPELGSDLGSGLYKIRLATKSKNKGQSGGFRVVNYLIRKNKGDCEINILLMYDKSEIEDIPKSELLKIVKSIFG